MIIRHIRNATLWIEYDGHTFLIDPMLGDPGSQKPFPNSPRQQLRNPLDALPVSIEDLLKAEYIVVTHLHRDHFDHKAKEAIPKDKQIFAQNKEDKQRIESYGFNKVEVLSERRIDAIRLIRTDARHSSHEMAKMSGPACGIVFLSCHEQSLYVVGDSVWYEKVEQVLLTYQPSVIVVNAGGNYIYGYDPLIMGCEDVGRVHETAPDALILAGHMESLNHWGVSKKELKKYAVVHHFSEQLWIPENGERIYIERKDD